jgi:hypothetical protein
MSDCSWPTSDGLHGYACSRCGLQAPLNVVPAPESIVSTAPFSGQLPCPVRFKEDQRVIVDVNANMPEPVR